MNRHSCALLFKKLCELLYGQFQSYSSIRVKWRCSYDLRMLLPKTFKHPGGNHAYSHAHTYIHINTYNYTYTHSNIYVGSSLFTRTYIHTYT